MLSTLAAVLSILASSATPPQEPGDCGVIRGRLDLWNGAPTVRIWVVGTRRMLGVSEATQGLEDLPRSVTQLLETADDRWSMSIFGDFEVCAVTRSRPGHMQGVRVIGARNLVVRPR